MPIVTPTLGQGYPSIATVNDCVRAAINDTFAGTSGIVGSGRIYTDDWTPNITHLNVALQELRRDLTIRGLKTVREVTFIINGITPLFGPQGLGIPDPTIQVYLAFGGYWDGNSLNTNINLPYDLLNPIKVGQRVTGSNNVFSEVCPAPDGLPSVYQNFLLGWWEWRQNQIFFNGSQNTMDIELTYKAGFPQYPTNLDPSLYSTTYIPILDCLDALSWRIASNFCAPRLPVGGNSWLDAKYDKAMVAIANEWVQTMQRSPVSRGSFGSEGGSWGYGGQGYGGVGS